MRRHLIILIFLTTIALHGSAQDTSRVLFIGNSFISSNNLPELFRSISTTSGNTVITGVHAPGGASVGDLFPGSYAHMDDPVVYDLIRSQDWDFVVVQDNQGRLVYDEGVFHPQARTIEGHKMLRDSVRFHHPCARLVWFAGWGFKNGQPPYGNTGTEMIQRIYANVRFIRDSLQEILSPIGPAWTRVITDMPSVALWHPDEQHPTLQGSYLAAATLAATIFRTDYGSLPHVSSFDTVLARQLRQIAYATVMDSLSHSGIPNYAPTLTVSGATLNATPGFQSYKWYRNSNYLQTTIAASLQLSQPGYYFVKALTTQGCEEQSPAIGYGLTGLEDPVRGIAVIYPNPADEFLTVGVERENSARLELTVYSADGRLIITEEFSGPAHTLYTGSLPPGNYLIRITGSREYRPFQFIRR